LFKHYGFEKTTVADIAHAARIGVGSVYLEFDSKETVARELSKRATG
jgi:AcrR family transcriptional regulator